MNMSNMVICKICQICTICIHMHKFHLYASMVIICKSCVVLIKPTGQPRVSARRQGRRRVKRTISECSCRSAAFPCLEQPGILGGGRARPQEICAAFLFLHCRLAHEISRRDGDVNNALSRTAQALAHKVHGPHEGCRLQ